MLKKLVAFFGFVSKDNFDAAIDALKTRERQLKILEEKLHEIEPKNRREKNKIIPLVSVDTEDPDRVKEVERKSYIARVAAFHIDVMDKKLKRMISDVRENIMQIGRDTFGYSQKDFDLYLKGTENALWLIHQWGELAVSEKVSVDSGNEELTEKETEELKAKIKN
jgi:hypothetical protein